MTQLDRIRPTDSDHMARVKLQAWNDILATYRLGRTIANGPLLTSHLVGMAIDGLARKACNGLVRKIFRKRNSQMAPH